MKKSLIILGHISLLVTIILALVFFKERVLYVDPGQQLFEMINEGGFKIFVSRYSMAINQTMPLLAIKMGWSLKAIMVTYSLSFVIVYYLCFLICIYKFKNIAAGLAIALAPILIRYVFGHSIAETWLGLGYSALFYAALNYKNHVNDSFSFRRFPYYTLLFAIILLNYFIHPSRMFLLIFSVGITCIRKKNFVKIWPYIWGILIVLTFSYRVFFTTYEYEEGFFDGVLKAPLSFSYLIDSTIFHFFKMAFWNTYIWFTLMYISMGFLLILKRKYVQLIFTTLFMLVYVCIAALAFYRSGHMAAEVRLLPLIFMVMVPLIEIIPDVKKIYGYAVGVLLAVCITWSFVHMNNTTRWVHTRRINYYKAVLKDLEKYPEKKFYTFKQKCYQSPLDSWGSAVETLLLTSLEGKEKSRTIFYFKKDEVPDSMWMNQPCNFLWVPWWTYYSEDFLNKKYFGLGCGPYREFENKECEN